MLILYYKCKLILGCANLFFFRVMQIHYKYVNVVPDTNQENMLTVTNVKNNNF